MKVKLLDRADINRYGKTEVDVPDHIAHRLVDEGKARFSEPPLQEAKALGGPESDKMVWMPPEIKSMEHMRQIGSPGNVVRVPGQGEPLFPSHIIGG